MTKERAIATGAQRTQAELRSFMAFEIQLGLHRQLPALIDFDDMHMFPLEPIRKMANALYLPLSRIINEHLMTRSTARLELKKAIDESLDPPLSIRDRIRRTMTQLLSPRSEFNNAHKQGDYVLQQARDVAAAKQPLIEFDTQTVETISAQVIVELSRLLDQHNFIGYFEAGIIPPHPTCEPWSLAVLYYQLRSELCRIIDQDETYDALLLQSLHPDQSENEVDFENKLALFKLKETIINNVGEVLRARLLQPAEAEFFNRLEGAVVTDVRQSFEMTEPSCAQTLQALEPLWIYSARNIDPISKRRIRRERAGDEQIMHKQELIRQGNEIREELFVTDLDLVRSQGINHSLPDETRLADAWVDGVFSQSFADGFSTDKLMEVISTFRANLRIDDQRIEAKFFIQHLFFKLIQKAKAAIAQAGKADLEAVSVDRIAVELFDEELLSAQNIYYLLSRPRSDVDLHPFTKTLDSALTTSSEEKKERVLSACLLHLARRCMLDESGLLNFYHGAELFNGFIPCPEYPLSLGETLEDLANIKALFAKIDSISDSDLERSTEMLRGEFAWDRYQVAVLDKIDHDIADWISRRIFARFWDAPAPSASPDTWRQMFFSSHGSWEEHHLARGKYIEEFAKLRNTVKELIASFLEKSIELRVFDADEVERVCLHWFECLRKLENLYDEKGEWMWCRQWRE